MIGLQSSSSSMVCKIFSIRVLVCLLWEETLKPRAEEWREEVVPVVETPISYKSMLTSMEERSEAIRIPKDGSKPHEHDSEIQGIHAEMDDMGRLVIIIPEEKSLKMSLLWAHLLIIKLTGRMDYEYALTGGPWLMFDHYLTLKQWHPDFDPAMAMIDRILAWIRLPGLPVEYYDDEFLQCVGNVVGKTIKIDDNTTSQCREKDNVKKIEYEGVHLICFGRGKDDHDATHCPSHTKEALSQETPRTSDTINGTTGRAEMLQSKDKMQQSVDLAASVSKSRFAGLEDEDNMEKDAGEESYGISESAPNFKSKHVSKKASEVVGRTGDKILRNESNPASFQEYKRMHKPDFVALLETRRNGLKREMVKRRLGYKYSAVAEARGFMGGIWEWIYCFVYASLRLEERDDLWSRLTALAQQVRGPWMLVGDFNDIGHPSEKKDGAPTNLRRCQKFTTHLNACNLMEIKTWGSRLEFSEAYANVLPRLSSDHHPLLIYTNDCHTSRATRPFRFEAAWTNHVDFKPFFQANWAMGESLPAILNSLPNLLLEWNH
ncbi:hypothetical protein Patl1_05175 [Pistacia atlantica]|uniref:Uncharacterized protein n=1 Tax=Pistacia atlantica TaxID=434234 RepID=A0ACC1BRM2_9ROSI|nr:hypothetical protein Patl1_05175 [Pistacia atlantica]